MRIEKVKVWFDDNTSARILRTYRYWVNKHNPEEEHGKSLYYEPLGFKKNKDDQPTKALKESIHKQLYEVMAKYNKEGEFRDQK